MGMARIFNPIRWQPVAKEAPSASSAATGLSQESRVGTQPVTNMFPSGPIVAAPATAAQEEGWLALLEIVFAATGWPDAD